jgi:hypothetical protein
MFKKKVLFKAIAEPMQVGYLIKNKLFKYGIAVKTIDSSKFYSVEILEVLFKI